MYYIVNETYHIIAVDEGLLNLCKVADIDELNRDIILDKIQFKPETDALAITTPTDTHSLSTNSSPLSSLLGKLTLITIDEEIAISSQEAAPEEIAQLIIEEPESDSDLIAIESPKGENLDTPENKIAEDLKTKESQGDEVDEAIEKLTLPTLSGDFIEMPTETPKKKKEDIYIDIEQVSQEIGVSKEDFNGFLNEYITTALELEGDLKGESESDCQNAVNTLSQLGDVLHLQSIGSNMQKIKESPKEKRLTHVSDFYDILARITTSKTVEETPRAAEEVPRIVEEVPKLEEVAPKIEETPRVEKHVEPLLLEEDEIIIPTAKSEKKEISDKIDIAIDEMLPLTLDDQAEESKPLPKEEKTDHTEHIDLDLDNIVLEDEKIDLDLDTLENDTKNKKEKITLELDSESENDSKSEEMINHFKHNNTAEKFVSFGKIDLKGTRPIRFDFSLSEAAEELSLPENLIEEFMVDFIAQAHTETDKMLEAYEKGDFESIKKIGHLLKGVSSNLRVTTLSQTLSDIQFCEDPDDLEPLIKDYWGHFLAFEKQIKLLSN